MGTLTKTWEQAKDLFASMTPGARITAALLLVVILVSLGFLFTFQSGSSSEYLLAGQSFDPGEIGKIQAAFGAAGLTEATIEGTKIKIPVGEDARYVAAMAAAGALPPRHFQEYMSQAMSELSAFAPSKERELAEKTAKQTILSEIVKGTPGVADASVMYDQEKARGLRYAGAKTASVTIWSTNNIPGSFDPRVADGIRNAVASAYAGLKLQDVTIIVDGITLHSPADALDPESGGHERYFAAQQQQERGFESKIRESLTAFIPGVTVTAFVELDPILLSRQVSRELDDKASATLSEISTDESTTSSNDPNGGRPPAQAGGANQQVAIVSGGGSSNDETSATRTERQSIPSSTDSEEIKAPLTPTFVSVAVGVPNMHLVELWRQDNPDHDPATEPTVAQLQPFKDAKFVEWQEHVAKTVPAGSEISITPFDTLPAPELPEAAFTDTAMSWMAQYGGTLGMVFLGLMGLLMVRSFVKSAAQPAEPARESTQSHEPTDDPDDASGDQPAKPAKKKWESAGADVKTQLAELVREDPETAASILQGWVSTSP